MAKRKTTTSTEVKNRYNAKTYKTITLHVKKAIAENFKAKCDKEGITQSSVLHKAIDDFLGED